jgi:hypothetical protein
MPAQLNMKKLPSPEQAEKAVQIVNFMSRFLKFDEPIGLANGRRYALGPIAGNCIIARPKREVVPHGPHSDGANAEPSDVSVFNADLLMSQMGPSRLIQHCPPIDVRFTPKATYRFEVRTVSRRVPKRSASMAIRSRRTAPIDPEGL